MDWLETLGTAIVAGSALGATVAGFFAYRQKSLVTVLREGNKDYKDRVIQLERDRELDQQEMLKQAKKIEILEAEKRLPLDQLTQLIVQQHSDHIKSNDKLAKQVATFTKLMKQVVKHLSKGEL